MQRCTSHKERPLHQELFVIRDAKADFYNPPFVTKTFAEAERTFSALANNPQTSIGQFPTDFDLYHLGTFDNVTGKMELHPSPKHQIKAVHLIQKIDPQMV